MQQERNKRRRVASNTEALQFTLRTSLSSETQDAGLASRARERAADALAKSVSAEAFTTAAMTLCSEGCDGLAEAEATASLCRIAREDAAEALTRCAVAERSSLRAAGAVCALAKRLEVVSGSDSVQGGQVGMRGVTIMSLPDVVVEVLFGILEEDNAPGFPSFPCLFMPRDFAFTCSRFAKLYREKHVKELRFCSVLRSPQDERVYFESVSGALGRFISVESVVVLGSDCVSRTLFLAQIHDSDSNPARDYGDPEAQILRLLSDPAAYFRNAADAHNLLAAAVFNCVNVKTKITQLHFFLKEESWNSARRREYVYPSRVYSHVDPSPVFAPNVAPLGFNVESAWDWMAEREHWLSYLPNVTSVAFNDFATLFSATRLCGPAIANLKMLTLSPCGTGRLYDDFKWHESTRAKEFGDNALLKLAEFGSIESLVLLDVDHEVPSDSVLMKVNRLVEALPKLRDLSIRLYPAIDSFDWPLLESLFPKPREPEGRNVTITISAAFRPALRKQFMSENIIDATGSLSDKELKEYSFREFQNAVVGEYSTNWAMTESLWCTIRTEGDSDYITGVVKYYSAQE